MVQKIPAGQTGPNEVQAYSPQIPSLNITVTDLASETARVTIKGVNDDLTFTYLFTGDTKGDGQYRYTSPLGDYRVYMMLNSAQNSQATGYIMISDSPNGVRTAFFNSNKVVCTVK